MSARSLSSEPCALVTVRQIEAITRRTVTHRILAPLGPTCIYQLKHAREITLLIERARFAQLIGSIRMRRRVTVDHRQAYCGQDGQPMLFAALPGGRVLAIAAGCSVAEKIDAIALTQLGL